MIYDLSKLKSNVVDSIIIDEDCFFDSDVIASTDIIDPFKVHVFGKITKSLLEGFDISCNVKGSFNLPCSLTLKPVSIPVDIEISGNIEELYEEIQENYKNIENSIDIFPIIWENILMEIPIKVTSPDATISSLKGEGWKLISEENNLETMNPELEKLKDLL